MGPSQGAVFHLMLALPLPESPVPSFRVSGFPVFYRVYGLGFRGCKFCRRAGVRVEGFRVWSLGLRVEGFRVWGLRFRV